MLAANYQVSNQLYGFGDHLSQNVGRGTDPSTAGPSLFRSRFDKFVPRHATNSATELEIGAVAEVSVQATYALTRQLSIDFGAQAMGLDGIGRPASMVNYTFPTLGINTDNNSQMVLMYGGYVGFNFNR